MMSKVSLKRAHQNNSRNTLALKSLLWVVTTLASFLEARGSTVIAHELCILLLSAVVLSSPLVAVGTAALLSQLLGVFLGQVDTIGALRGWLRRRNFGGRLWCRLLVLLEVLDSRLCNLLECLVPLFGGDMLLVDVVKLDCPCLGPAVDVPSMLHGEPLLNVLVLLCGEVALLHSKGVLGCPELSLEIVDNLLLRLNLKFVLLHHHVLIGLRNNGLLVPSSHLSSIVHGLGNIVRLGLPSIGNFLLPHDFGCRLQPS